MVFNSSHTFNLEQLKAMLALMPNPVIINKRCVNESGEAYEEIVYVNPVFESTLGYTIEDIPTHEAWFDKAYPDRNYQAYIIKEWRKSLETAAKNDTPLLGFTCKVFTKKGAYKWFEVTSQINSNILNDYYLIVFLEVDAPEDAILNLQSLTNELIEKNHELERSKSVLDEVQEIAQIGSWEIDLVENTISWSPELFNIFMEDPATHVPTLEDFYRRLEPEEATLVQQQIEQAIQTGEKRSVVVTSKRGDGSPLSIEIYGRAVYDELSGQPIKLVGATMDISDRVELLTENGELAKLIRVAQQELYIVDYETDKFVYVNESASRNTGYSIQELLDFTVHDINPQLTPERVKQMKLAGQALDKMHNTSIHQRKDGSTYPVHATLQRVTYKNRPCYAIFDIDITELKAIEQILDDQLKLFENIIDSVPVRIYWKDLHGAYLGANKHFLKDAELQSNSELIGKTDLDLIWAESSGEAYLLEDFQVMESGVEKLQVEEIVTKANGERMVLSNSKVPLTNTKGEIVGLLGTYEDITQRRKMQDELMKHQEALHHQAHHDLLTNLPNRLLLQDRLVSAARHAKRSGQSFAVMFIDLDQFKQINDAMGHDVGDRVLQEIARRLYAEIGPIDTLARIGGD
ncbi:MAG: PAS domain S-box protein [Thiotrichales bacterium]|nr:PAS domain S-box protein [Thiotrichales bacterium]